MSWDIPFNSEGTSCVFKNFTFLPEDNKCTTEQSLSDEKLFIFGFQIQQCDAKINKTQSLVMKVVKPPRIEIKAHSLFDNVLNIKEGNITRLECLQIEKYQCFQQDDQYFHHLEAM